ncbi:MAG: hypothetical protein H0W72_16785 [Planctomycetes bacterium]|nr:hypothetical protein [Planctomycetota bacterium]
MNPPRLVAMIALLLVLLAIVLRLFSNPEMASPQPPSHRGAPVAFLVANVPAIGDFAGEFYINDLNPFVPINERAPEKAALEEQKRPQVVKATKLPPPPKNVIVEEPPKKPELPTLAGSTTAVPKCVGLIRHSSGRSALIVRMGAEGVEQRLGIGDLLEGWQLVELGQHNATFRDPSGAEQVLPIAPEAKNLLSASPGESFAPAGNPSAPPVDPAAQPSPDPSGGAMAQPPPPMDADRDGKDARKRQKQR